MATEYLQHKKKLKGIRYMLLAIALINALITIAFKVIASFKGELIPMYLPSMLVGLFAYIIPIMIYAKINNITDKVAAEKFYLKKTRGNTLLLSAIIGIGCQFVMVIVNLPLNLLLDGATSYLPESIAELFLATIAIALVPAIFEEFLFRGIVYGSMSEFNTKAALIFSVSVFTILHADIYGFLGYIFLGIILAVIVSRTNSLLPVIVCHFTNNFTALLLGFFNNEITYDPSLTITLFVLGIICFIASFWVFISKNKKPDRVDRIKKSQLLGQSFINVPIILCIVVIVITGIITRTI